MKTSKLKYRILDLHFQGIAHNIASFAVPVREGKWLLVETGPYSCHSSLIAELGKNGISLSDIENVFVTHIHLDHSGGAWALAEAGARIHVHPIGAPHLIDPSKLYESAQRIYGERMETLWSKVGPISVDKVHSVVDGETLVFPGEEEEIVVTAHYTPGHASHHISWQINDVLFAGDVCGVRLNEKMVEIPAPPPEFHLGQWKDSLAKIRKLTEGRVGEIALTHFGSYRDTDTLLHAAEGRLEEITAWFRGQVRDKEIGDWKVTLEEFTDFLKKRYRSQGISEEEIFAICNITPPDMTITGVLRYLKKFENPEPEGNRTGFS